MVSRDPMQTTQTHTAVLLHAALVAKIREHTDRAGITVEDFAAVMLEDAAENAEELIGQLWTPRTKGRENPNVILFRKPA